jgi:putative aldouronate transport system substrate-binding protein
MWNKTLADKYGLEPDPAWRSFRDWVPLLEVIKENERDVLPILAEGNWYHMNWISYIECDLGWNGFSGDPTLLFLWENKYYTDELYAMREMYQNEFVPRDAVSSDTDYNTKHLQMGDFFLTTQPLKPGKGKSTELMSQLLNKNVVYDEFDTTPLMVNTNHCGGSMLAIANTSKDPARAMMFINEMHVNPDVINLLAWGIEGVHYTVTQAANPKRVTPIEGNTWVSAMNGWMIGNFFEIYLSADEPADKYDLLRATKEGIPAHLANGYRFDPEPWLDTITAVNNAKEEFQKNLCLGASDTDEGLQSLISAVDAAGLRPYYAAVKSDFDEWLSKK